MAENESLDLRNPGGQRWNQVHDAISKKQPPEDVAKKVQRKLPAALRKAFKEFAEMGVPFEQFLANRHNSQMLRRFVRKCQGHEYAHLFAETAAAESTSSDQWLVVSFLNGIMERVTDQIAQHVVPSDHWSSFTDIRDYLAQVSQQIEPEMQRIARKLAEDPTWRPTSSRTKKGERSDPTEEMLNMSLLGMAKK